MAMMDLEENKSSPSQPTKNNISEAIVRLHRRGATAHLSQLLSKLKATDISQVLNGFPEHRAQEVFSAITPTSHAAAVLEHLDDAHKQCVMRQMSNEQAWVILNNLPLEVRTAILSKLDDATSERLQETLETKQRPQRPVDNYSYKENTAGSLMETNILALPQTMTAAEAIHTIQDLADQNSIFYLYVVDEMHRLTGVCSLRRLILANPDKLLMEFTSSRLVKVHVDAPQGNVAKQISRHRLLAVPVVDELGMLVGQITIDNLIDIIQEENTESIMKMAGIGSSKANVLTQTPLQIFATRVPWLITAFIAYLAISAILDGFEHTLSAVVQLAFFFPIVIGMSGNAGSQTGAVVVRGLALGTLHEGHFFKLLFRELAVNFIQGGIYGLALAGASYLIFQNHLLSMTLGIAMTLSISCSAVIAMSLPYFFKKLGADPAVAAGPMALAFIDMVGSINYLTVAFFMFKL
ncbi:magnesium transporter [Candidatus Magnetaquicoccus inordinatus]|uniref:magnesium transporter n=1 Tax=Candidatus Magnetaquicoccus inordinatus TaxID=2496818 RepID=UPI00102CB664|nr:magnesium transporter [Candidatus Magnetaquicoccus inordinatus]